MKTNTILLVLNLLIFLPYTSLAYTLPEYSEESMTKVVMPGGLYFFMEKDDALELLKKRHPVETFDGGAYYQISKNGIQETYQIRFVCNRVWAMEFSILGPDDETFYENFTPLKKLINQLREYYSGPIYGDYDVNASLDEDERIKFVIFDHRYDGKVSMNISHFVGDLFAEPEITCPSDK